MQIEELNEVKEQVRENTLKLFNYVKFSYVFASNNAASSLFKANWFLNTFNCIKFDIYYNLVCAVTCWTGARKIQKFCPEEWDGQGNEQNTVEPLHIIQAPT